MLNNNKNCMKATIKSLIVAFIYVSIIAIVLYTVFSEQIMRANSLINLISVETSEKVLKDIKIDLTTRNLIEYPDYGTKYGQIKLPSLNLDLPLYYGDTLSILRYGVGHSSGSYFPGEGGSILCMGHNYAGILKTLPDIKINDEIIIETTYGIFTYQVNDTKIVYQDDLSAASIQDEKETLMLYTCYPTNGLGHAVHRFFVYADLINEEIKMD